MSDLRRLKNNLLSIAACVDNALSDVDGLIAKELPPASDEPADEQPSPTPVSSTCTHPIEVRTDGMGGLVYCRNCGEHLNNG